MVRVSPGSPSQWNATWSPRPASTWRSRQLYETLSVPPDEPLGDGQVPLEGGVEVGHQVEQLRGLPGPERLGVGVGLVVEVGAGRQGRRAGTPRAAGRCGPRGR